MQFLPLAPSGWPQDVQKRYPKHLWMQKSGFPKNLVSLKKSKVFSLGIPVDIPLVRSEAATASHLDSKIQSDSWVTPLPHSAENKKKLVFGFFPLPSSAPTLFLAMPPGAGTSGGPKGRGKRAEKREKREEKREKMDFWCFS